MGSKIRSKMPEPGYSILQKQREFLCNELVAGHLVDDLFSFQILDDDDKDRIEKAESRSNKDGVRTMLDILSKSGPNAYDKFLKALICWIDDLPDEKKNKSLNEKNLLRLSNFFANGWEGVVLFLGNSEAQVYQDKENNRSSTQMQLFSALNRWRQRKARDATVKELLTAMRLCSSCIIEWDSVQKYVTDSTELNHCE
ncbi:hypothetical protein LOTGIDRAFT_228817 [Lottia gigantea]|uniref:CARD domain-containing protein n=1 Tax=Lottia gigantea TaxID=225164 RepID=V4ADJ1_LOTGI|nr:hypothetical protein LOTGIDRAFT_228817 [Lottia gigantea]ESO91376.1 hypothetical protein LOTGIDRAFT_228817 [Lottia gigantea]